MPQADLYLVFTEPLESAALRYMVTGSIASIIYGEPRLTHDIDFVLAIDRHDVSELTDIFPEDRFYCPPVDVILVESGRRSRGHINIIHHDTGFKADIYFQGSDLLNQWGLEKCQKVKSENGKSLWVAPPEYVIVRKLEYFREGGSEKHLRDIRGMLEVSDELINSSILYEWIDRLHLRDEWNQVSQK